MGQTFKKIDTQTDILERKLEKRLDKAEERIKQLEDTVRKLLLLSNLFVEDDNKEGTCL